MLLDIAPEVAAARKAQNRDRFERDLPHARPRAGELPAAGRRTWLWIVVDAARPVDVVAADVASAIASRLGLP